VEDIPILTFSWTQDPISSDQLLAHGRWFSPCIPASSTTNTGRHDIAEILLKMALKHQISIINQPFCPSKAMIKLHWQTGLKTKSCHTLWWWFYLWPQIIHGVYYGDHSKLWHRTNMYGWLDIFILDTDSRDPVSYIKMFQHLWRCYL
jgi:hypothetical protein